MENSAYATNAATQKTKNHKNTISRRMRSKSANRTVTGNTMDTYMTTVETGNVVNFNEYALAGGAVLPSYVSYADSAAAAETYVPVIESYVPAEVTVVRPRVGVKTKPFYAFTKRLFDIVSSGLAIVMLSPLLLVLALLVKCTSKGPVFYVSDRVGKNGKTFKFLKFRSMCVDADEKLEELLPDNEAEGGVIFKMKDDPRVTKFGKFIRRTSLDELPQLFNIFVGDMTVVGPRPCTTREYALYSERDKERLQVKQGLTCIWQCSGRSNTTFEQQIDMDLDYIERRGFFFDLWLILKTFVAVFKHDGAV